MNRYEIKDEIGAGGHGQVFRAKLIGTEDFARPVAIKRIREQLSGDERYTKLFIQEARIASTLEHPNIVSVLDFYRDEGRRLCLVMELVRGVSLSELIKSGPLPFPVVIYVITEVLRGLGYAHGAPFKLVHRDVTPRNILVGWNGAVKLSDFGLAKAQAMTGAALSGPKGTRGYISPEHIQDERLDGRADLFAVGTILYQLLTGQIPFRCRTYTEYIFAVVRGEIERPRNIRPDIPEELEAITMRLLERNRDKRYASAQAAIDALLQCEHASPRARDELAAMLAESFSAAGQHAAMEPSRKTASTPRPDVNALVQANTDAQIRAQILALHKRDDQGSRITEEMPPDVPDVQQRERFSSVRSESAPPPKRRGWLAALCVAAVLVVAVLTMWPSHAPHPSSTAQDTPDDSLRPAPAWKVQGDENITRRVFWRTGRGD